MFAIGESFVHSWLIDGFLFDEWFNIQWCVKPTTIH